MPDTNGDNRKPSDKHKFMREKIEKQPLTRRELALRAAIAVCLAALCGGAAALGFVFTRDAAGRMIGQESAETTATVSFTKDEPESQPAETSGDEAAETESCEEIPLDKQQLEEQVSQAIGEYPFGMPELSSMYDSVRRLAQETDRGVVTVHSETRKTDWFGNPVESMDQAAGIIIAKTGREILIFTGLSSIADTENIEIVFSGGETATADVKQTDQVVGMAVLSVDAAALAPGVADGLPVIELGNSYSVKQGDMVLAVGSPAGIVHSVNFGFISYVAKNVQMTDSMSRIFYTGMEGNADVGTFIIGTDGKMLGWVTGDFKNENSQNMTAIFSISDYKPALERLSNGRSVAYFGVRGQEVSAKMTEQGMPAGVYVADAMAGGPAYEAGIQNGDIITEMAGREILTVKDIQTQLENLESGQEITVKVRRPSREEYKELEYRVNLRAR